MSDDTTLQLALTINDGDIIEGAKQVLETVRPHWDLTTTNFKVFTDGITNKLLGCFPQGDSENGLLIRVYGHKTDLLIDRDSELQTMRRLHSAGLGSQLFATFSNGLVYEYVPGVVLTVSNCTQWNIAVLVASKMADMHRTEVTASRPGIWTKLNKFLNLVPAQFSDKDKQARFRSQPGADKATLAEQCRYLESSLCRTSSPVVFCHNDLLLANVIFDEERNKLSFIDYEYAELNHQAFDIGNHFNEFAGVDNVDYSRYPSEDFQKRWIKVYLDRFEGGTVMEEKVSEVYLEVQQFSVVSHLFWALWALIQAEHSSIEFDFLGYGFQRLEQYFIRKNDVFGS